MDIEGLKEQLRRCHLRTGLEVVEEAANEIDRLERELEEVRKALAYAIKEADAWSDDSTGMPIETPEMDAARAIAAREKQSCTQAFPFPLGSSRCVGCGQPDGCGHTEDCRYYGRAAREKQ